MASLLSKILCAKLTLQHKIGHRLGLADGVDRLALVFRHVLIHQPADAQPRLAFGVAKVDAIAGLDGLVVAPPADCGLCVIKKC